MATQTPNDDIIELTDIVEEGIALDTQFDDLPMEKAIDAKSLDQELDDLLNEATPAAAAIADDDLNLLTETLAGQDSQKGQKTQSASSVDLSDLDDLFDALGAEPDRNEATALDALLDGDQPDSMTPSTSRPADPQPSLPEDDLPRTEASKPEFMDLTEELLADIPDTLLTAPGSEIGKSPASTEPQDNNLSLFLDDDLDMGLGDDLDSKPQTAPPTTDEPGPDNLDIPSPDTLDIVLDTSGPAFKRASAQPVQAKSDSESQPPLTEPGATDAGTELLMRIEKLEAKDNDQELADLKARIEQTMDTVAALEARPEPVLDIRPEHILAAMPESPDQIPFAQALQNSILSAVEAKLQAGNNDQELADLKARIEQTMDTVAALEARPEPTLDIQPEHILAAMPESPDQVPFAQALQSSILSAVEAKLQAGNNDQELADLKARIEQTMDTVAALEARPEPTLDIRPEHILAAMPESPDQVPFAQALQNSILSAMEAKLQAGNNDQELADLKARIEQTMDTVATLEARSEPTLDIRPEHILAAMPESPDKMPFVQTLRADLVDEIESRLGALATTASVDALQRSVSALQSQVDALPDMMATPAPPHAAMEEIESELNILRKLVQRQEVAMMDLQQALAVKDSEIQRLQAAEAQLKQELQDLTSAKSSSDLANMQAHLEQFIRQQIPDAAAQIIRQEIQNLLADMA